MARWRNMIVGLALLAWLPGCVTIPRARVDVPAGVLDGDRVPVLVSCTPPLHDGETLVLKAGKDDICRVQPFGGFLLAGFGTNVRLLNPGAVEAVVASADGRRTASGRRIDLSSTGSIPAVAGGSKRSRVRVEDGRIDLWFDNAMAATGYLQEVTVKTDVGGVRITNTPYLAANPLYRIVSPIPINRIDVTTVP